MAIRHIDESLGVSEMGPVEHGSVTYSLYELEGSMREMMVYRPQGWLHDPPQVAVYILHGAGFNGRSLLGVPGHKRQLARVVDTLTACGRIPPTLVVAPNWSDALDVDSALASVRGVSDLLRTVVARAEGSFGRVSAERRIACGFSMGGTAMWEAMLGAPELFSTFVPIGGECWIPHPEAGTDGILEASKAIISSLASTGKQRHIVAACGQLDPALEAMLALVDRIEQDAQTTEDSRQIVSAETIVIDGRGHEQDIVPVVLDHVLTNVIGQTGTATPIRKVLANEAPSD